MKEIQLTADNFAILEIIRKIKKLKKFSEKDLLSLLTAGKLREYQAKEIVIKEGSSDCWLYLLISGHLTIKKKDQTIGTLRRCGDMFGEMGIIDGSPRSASIEAHSKSVLIGFDASVIFQNLKSGQVNFGYLIYRVFAEILAVRLRETTELNVALSQENELFKEQLRSLRSHSSRTPLNTQLKLEHLAQKKVLIVDSIESTRKILRSLLRELKFKDIIESVDGENALKALKNQKIDIIIADFDLQKMSGLDLLKKIRGIPALATIPCILIINESDKENTKLIIKENKYQYLVKPYTANMLYEKFSKVLT